MKNMPKDQMERIMHKMYHKRNFMLRAFVINLVLIIAVWGLSMADFYADMAGHFMHCPAAQAETYTMDLLGAWKIAGVLFFLVPALAAWWELHACKKHMEQ